MESGDASYAAQGRTRVDRVDHVKDGDLTRIVIGSQDVVETSFEGGRIVHRTVSRPITYGDGGEVVDVGADIFAGIAGYDEEPARQASHSPQSATLPAAYADLMAEAALVQEEGDQSPFSGGLDSGAFDDDAPTVAGVTSPYSQADLDARVLEVTRTPQALPTEPTHSTPPPGDIFGEVEDDFDEQTWDTLASGGYAVPRAKLPPRAKPTLTVDAVVDDLSSEEPRPSRARNFFSRKLDEARAVVASIPSFVDSFIPYKNPTNLTELTHNLRTRKPMRALTRPVRVALASPLRSLSFQYTDLAERAKTQKYFLDRRISSIVRPVREEVTSLATFGALPFFSIGQGIAQAVRDTRDYVTDFSASLVRGYHEVKKMGVAAAVDATFWNVPSRIKRRYDTLATYTPSTPVVLGIGAPLGAGLAAFYIALFGGPASTTPQVAAITPTPPAVEMIAEYGQGGYTPAPSTPVDLADAVAHAGNLDRRVDYHVAPQPDPAPDVTNSAPTYQPAAAPTAERLAPEYQISEATVNGNKLTLNLGPDLACAVGPSHDDAGDCTRFVRTRVQTPTGIVTKYHYAQASQTITLPAGDFLGVAVGIANASGGVDKWLASYRPSNA